MWIRVDRKMPAVMYRKGVCFSDPVLVKVGNEKRIGYTFNGKWRILGRRGEYDGEENEGKVTAWMEIPD